MRRIFLATLLVFMMSAATAFAATWEQVYVDDSENLIFFDTESVNVYSRTDTDVTFDASFKMVYSDKGRNLLIDWYRNNSIMPRNIENLSYDVAKIQFKKEGDARYYHISERIAYTGSGAQIVDMHYTNPNTNWIPIEVGSVIDVEYYNAMLIVDGKRFHPKS